MLHPEWRSSPGRWTVRGRRGGEGRGARGDGDRIYALSEKGEQEEERRAEPRVSQIPVAPPGWRRRPSAGGSSAADAEGIEERPRWNWERRWWREGRVVVFGRVWRGWGGQEGIRGSHGGTVRAGERGRSWLGGFEQPNRGFWMGGGSAMVSREETSGAVVVQRPVDREDRDKGGVFFFYGCGRAVDGDDGGTDHEGGDEEGSDEG